MKMESGDYLIKNCIGTYPVLRFSWVVPQQFQSTGQNEDGCFHGYLSNLAAQTNIRGNTASRDSNRV